MIINDLFPGTVPYREPSPTNNKKLLYSWPVGLEFEWERVYELPSTFQGRKANGWVRVRDGSLRDGGMEFRSETTNRGRGVLNKIEIMYGWGEQMNWSRSSRTSIHVHLDVRSLTVEELYATLVTYALVEPLLCHFAGKQREHSIFCIPWYRAIRDAARLGSGWTQYQKLLKEKDPIYHARSILKMFDASAVRSCKYSALHTEPIRRQGSIEFRHAPVFADKQACITWVNLITALGVFGMERGHPNNVLEYYSDLTPYEFSRLVFGQEFLKRIHAYNSDLADLWDEMYQVESVAEQVIGLKKVVRDAWGFDLIKTTRSYGNIESYCKSTDIHNYLIRNVDLDLDLGVEPRTAYPPEDEVDHFEDERENYFDDEHDREDYEEDYDDR
jgi:hypothetical protein